MFFNFKIKQLIKKEEPKFFSDLNNLTFEDEMREKNSKSELINYKQYMHKKCAEKVISSMKLCVTYARNIRSKTIQKMVPHCYA